MSEISLGYVRLDDLIFNGPSDCKLLTKKPRVPHLELKMDEEHDWGKGLASFSYRNNKIAYQSLYNPYQGVRHNGPTEFLYNLAYKWALRNMYKIYNL